MKLWKISQTENNDWDTYDSAVVAAETEDDAKSTYPNELQWPTKENSWDEWASSPDNVKCQYLGEAKDGTDTGVILASYNAG